MNKDEDSISKYLSKDYFYETQDEANELDESLLVSPLLTDYIGNITGRSKSRSTRKKMRDSQNRTKSASKLRKRLADKFENDNSYCSTPGSDHGDSLLDASGFSLGLGSPSLDKSFERDEVQSRVHDVRDITIFENEELSDSDEKPNRRNDMNVQDIAKIKTRIALPIASKD